MIFSTFNVIICMFNSTLSEYNIIFCKKKKETNKKLCGSSRSRTDIYFRDKKVLYQIKLLTLIKYYFILYYLIFKLTVSIHISIV